MTAARKAPEVAKPAEPEVTKPAEAEVAEPPAPEVDVAEPAGDQLTIVMQVAVSGYHDGEPWPGRGEPVTLPRVDAEEYLRLGYATAAESE